MLSFYDDRKKKGCYLGNKKGLPEKEGAARASQTYSLAAWQKYYICCKTE